MSIKFGLFLVGLLALALLASGQETPELGDANDDGENIDIVIRSAAKSDEERSSAEKERVDLVVQEFVTSGRSPMNGNDLSALFRQIGQLFSAPKSSNATSHDEHDSAANVQQTNLRLNCVTLKLKELEVFLVKMFHVSSSEDEDEVMIKSDKFPLLQELIDTYLDACFTSLPKASDGHSMLKGKMALPDSQEALAPTSSFIINKKNWIYAFLAGTFIGIAGLLCYTIMPLLNLFYFSFFLQFLVALAVGSLIGDALLHLIPQAFSNEGQMCGMMDHSASTSSHSEPMKAGHHMDRSAVLKGVGAVVGIYFFFLIEKFMRLHRSRNEKKQLNAAALQKAPSQGKQTADENANRLESYSMYEESALDAKNSREKYVSTEFNRIKFDEDSDNASGSINTNDNKSQVNLNLLDDSLPLLPLISEDVNESHHYKRKGNDSSGGANNRDVAKLKHCHERNFDSKNFENVKLVAWMVIMGDGLHNFMDGLAIGASFANSITAGIGTSIAVLFHELPHEIGDFAVLRRAGVTLRRAILFNAFSGLLCLVGVGVGLFIGTLELFSKWSLLFTAGVFLYISLVDMIPELSEDKETFLNILIQSFGVLAGVGVMLFIALFEDKILQLLQ